MSGLFDSTTIASMTLPNRSMRSATWEGMAGDDGSVTPQLTQAYVDLAKGRVGLIITGHASVSPEGQAGQKQLSVCRDALSPGLAALAKAVHAAGGRIALQLAHAGDQANTKLSGLSSVGPTARAVGTAATGAGTLSSKGHLPCHALDQAGIDALVQAFARAGARAKAAGFDAVQVHAAHGYLMHQFLSPVWNTRTDQYGGSVENRARFLLQVVRAVREAVGPQYPVLAKMDSEDFIPGGFSLADSEVVAVWLEEAGVDALELSGGCRQAGDARMSARKGAIRIPDGEVYYREAAKLIKSLLKIPLILVGGIRSFEVAGELITSGTADYISFARPFICEPDLIKRWQEGDTRPALCVSDNLCYGPAYAGEGVRCVTFEKKRANTEAGQHMKVPLQPIENFENEGWDSRLTPESRHLFDLIDKYHIYFNMQDKKYRWIVRILKVLILFLAMASTIVLGLKTVITVDIQVVVGLLLSSFITFLTAISSYFNFEEYWIRNISIHIRLNIMRDNFIFYAKANALDKERIEFYRKELEEIQMENINYWKKAIKRI